VRLLIQAFADHEAAEAQRIAAEMIKTFRL
jgi:hypothetical protein